MLLPSSKSELLQNKRVSSPLVGTNIFAAYIKKEESVKK